MRAQTAFRILLLSSKIQIYSALNKEAFNLLRTSVVIVKGSGHKRHQGQTIRARCGYPGDKSLGSHWPFIISSMRLLVPYTDYMLVLAKCAIILCFRELPGISCTFVNEIFIRD